MHISTSYSLAKITKKLVLIKVFIKFKMVAAKNPDVIDKN